MFAKEKTYRSDDYTAFVDTLECAVFAFHKDARVIDGSICQGLVTHHHTETGGVGMKGSDLSCVPLCNGHHFEVHNTLGKQTFDKVYNLDLATVEVIRANQAYIEDLESQLERL